MAHAFDLNQDKTPVCKEKVFSNAAFFIFCHLSTAPFFLANEDNITKQSIRRRRRRLSPCPSSHLLLLVNED